MDVLDRLPPDEPVLHESRVRGRAPWPSCAALVLVAFGALIAQVTVTLTLTVGATTFRVPPLVSYGVLIVALYAARHASWRSGRWVVTPRRLLFVRGVVWHEVQASWRRAGGEQVVAGPAGLELRGLADEDVLLEGVDAGDAADIARALATFDAAPAGPLPPRFWSRRKKALLVLLTLLALAGAIVHRAAPWRTTATATWTRVGTTLGLAGMTVPGGTDTVTLEVDAPIWGGPGVTSADLWYVEVDGRPVGVGSSSKRAAAGLLRMELTETGSSGYAVPTSASTIVVHGAVQRGVDGPETPFSITVTPLRPAELDLGPLLAAPPEQPRPRRYMNKTLREWAELLAEDPSDPVRHCIYRHDELYGPDDADAVPALVRALEHPNPEGRYLACRLLGYIGPAARDQALARVRALAAGDPDGTVRSGAEAAARGMSR